MFIEDIPFSAKTWIMKELGSFKSLPEAMDWQLINEPLNLTEWLKEGSTKWNLTEMALMFKVYQGCVEGLHKIGYHFMVSFRTPTKAPIDHVHARYGLMFDDVLNRKCDYFGWDDYDEMLQETSDLRFFTLTELKILEFNFDTEILKHGMTKIQFKEFTKRLIASTASPNLKTKAILEDRGLTAKGEARLALTKDDKKEIGWVY